MSTPADRGEALEPSVDGASEEAKSRAVLAIIRAASSRAAIIALQPLPFVDGALLTPIQLRMVDRIGRVRGQRDRELGRTIVRTLAGRLVAPHLAIAGAKLVLFVPFFGTLVSFSVAYALTYALGEVSDEALRAGSVMSQDELRVRFGASYRRTFAETYRRKRDDLKAKLRRAG